MNVYDEVKAERTRQEKKWGEQNHRPADYLMILGEEVGEANKAALEMDLIKTNEDGYYPNGLMRPRMIERYREELVQIAAVAIAMIECVDRNK